MSRFCEITGKKVLKGNKVSHAGNRTRRFFRPNIQTVSFFSEVLGYIRVRASAQGMRLVEVKGGIDSFLMRTPDTKLTSQALIIKRCLKKQEKKKRMKKKETKIF